jgi:hypothetical protein
MKTIREYLDLIKENEQPSWQEIVAEVVKKYGLPKKVLCNIRYREYNRYLIDYIGRDGKQYQLDTVIEIGGKGQAVSYDKFPQDHTTLNWLYGPAVYSMDAGDHEGFEPSYTDTASLCSLIEMYCLSDNLDQERIYYDVHSYDDKYDNIRSVYTTEEGVDAIEVLKELSSGVDFDWGDYSALDDGGVDGSFNYNLMYSLVHNGEGSDRIIGGYQDREEMERDIDRPIGGAYVEWPSIALEFDKQGDKVVLVDSENVLSKIMTPAEKSTTTKTKRPQPANNIDDQNGEIQP